MDDETKALVEAQAAQIAKLGNTLAEANAEYERASDERDLFRATADRLKRRVDSLQAQVLHPCRHTRTSEQESDRPDLHDWQTAQKEWFDATILEIVSEYAAWRDAQPDPRDAEIAALTKERNELLCDYRVLVNQRDEARTQIKHLWGSLRKCRKAISNGSEEPRRTVREIVDEALAKSEGRQ